MQVYRDDPRQCGDVPLALARIMRAWPFHTTGRQADVTTAPYGTISWDKLRQV
jgi:hypothetical protein